MLSGTQQRARWAMRLAASFIILSVACAGPSQSSPSGGAASGSAPAAGGAPAAPAADAAGAPASAPGSSAALDAAIGIGQTPRRGGELTLVVGAELPSFDGHRESSFAMLHWTAPHYSLLVTFDPFDYGKVVG